MSSIASRTTPCAYIVTPIKFCRTMRLVFFSLFLTVSSFFTHVRVNDSSRMIPFLTATSGMQSPSPTRRSNVRQPLVMFVLSLPPCLGVKVSNLTRTHFNIETRVCSRKKGSIVIPSAGRGDLGLQELNTKKN